MSICSWSFGQVTAPYTETFDNTTTPANWSSYNKGTGSWIFSTGAEFDAASAGDHTGNFGNYAWIDFSGTNDDSVCLESPAIDVSSLTTPQLSFWFFSNNTNTTDLNILFVEAWDGSAWVQVDSIQEDNGGWTEYLYDVSTFKYNVDSVKVRFRGETLGATNDYYNDLLIDDFGVDEQPSCPKVSSLSAINIKRDSVTITWDNGAVDSSWIVQYGAAGFTLGTGNVTYEANDTVVIDNLNPNTPYDFYVRSICTVGDTSVWVGPLSITTMLSCPAPSFTLTDETSSTISLIVSPGSYDSSYVVEYGTAGFAYGTGTTLTSSNDTLMITGLSSNTGYDFYLKSVCSVGDTSTLVGSLTTNTTCGVIAAYWMDSVELHNTTTNSSIANCWSSSPSGTTTNFRWDVDGSLSTPSSSTGPSGAFSGSNYFYTEASSGDEGDSAILLSPIVDVSILSVPSLSFYYHMYGSTMGELHVDVYDSVGVLHSSVWSISGEQQASAGAAWEQAVIDLLPFGDTVQVRFVAIRSTNFYGDISLDDIAFEEGPACFDPSGLTDVFVGSDSVNLTWNTSSFDSAYQIQYGPQGFPIGFGTTVLTLNDSLGINSLTDNASYDFYIRTICRVGDTSVWIGPISLQTECATKTSPWFDNVEANSTTTNSTLDNCWSSNPTGTTSSFRWNVDGSGSTPSSSTGPSGAYSGSNYFYVEATSGSSGDTARLTSANIDVSTLAIPTLSFYYHMYGSGMGDLYVDVYDGTSWHLNIDSIKGEQQTDDLDEWRQAFVNLSAYAGGTVKIRFTAVKGTSGIGDISLDNIAIDEEPSCYKPTSITSFNVTEDSVFLTWDTASTDSIYQVEYGPQGFALGSGMLKDSTFDTLALAGLMPATTYDVYLRNICSVGDTSDWYGPVTFTTLCPDSGFIPSYLQEFTSYVPLCWEEAVGVINDSTILTYGASNWTSDGFSNVGTTGAANVTISGTTVDEWLISPSIDLGDGTIGYQLEFDVSMTQNGSTNADTMQYDDTLLLVISPDNGATWADTNALMVWGDGTEPSVTGDHVTIPLAGYTNQVKFGFYAESSVTGEFVEVFIDNFWVREVPNCLEPDSLHTLFIGEDSAVVSWLSTVNDSTWIVEYGNQGFTQGLGVYDTLSTDTAFINGLMPNSPYDVYVKSICKSLDTSIWVGPFTFTTACPAVFMSPYYDSVENHTPVLNSDINSCWTSIPALTTSDYRWNVDGAGSTPSSSTGPTGANSGVNYFYTEASSGSTGDSAFLISPLVEVSTLTIPALEFNYHMYGSTMGELYVDVYDGTSWDRGVWVVSGEQQTSASDAWRNAVVDLSAYGDTIQVRFRAVRSTSYFGDISLDDIAIIEGPSCFDPSNLTTSFLGYDSVNATWGTNSTDSLYIIEYGVSGFPLGTGTSITTTNDSLGVNGLTPQIGYDFYIKNVCSIGDTSAWFGPLTITTLCAPITAPHIEQFNTTTLSTCWDETGDNGWEYGGDLTTPTGFAGYGAENAPDFSTPAIGTFIGMDGSDNGDGEVSSLVTPFVDISALTTPGLMYAVFSNNVDDAAQNKLIVEVYNGSTWIVVDSIQTNLGSNWVKRYIDLSAFSGSLVQARYTVTGVSNGGSTFYNDILLDDIEFADLPPCTPIMSVSAFGAGKDSINVTWVPGISDSVYLVEYGPSGFAPGTGTVISTLNDTLTVNSLNPDTEYDFYVRGICTGGDTSVNIGPATDTTLPLCVRTSSFTVLGSDSSSINVGWNIDTSHTTYIIEYGVAGFTIGTGSTAVVTSPTNFYTANGLSPQTTYDFYIRSVCTSGDTSVWDGPYQGTTDCSTTPLPWSEGFENLTSYGSGVVPLCWLQDGDWVTDSTTGTYNRAPRTGNGYLYTNYGADDWVYTPYFKLNTTGVYELSFWYSTDGAAWDSLRVGVGANQTVASMSQILYRDDNLTNTAYQEVKVYFTPTTSGSYTFGVHTESSFTPWYMMFDDFSLRDTTQIASVSELSLEDSFEIYPNPNNGEFKILNKGETKTSFINILDAQGRVVYQSKTYFGKGDVEVVNLSDIDKGIYILQIKTEGILNQYKVIID